MLAGLACAIATPPLRYPDEAGHLLRTAKVAAELFHHDRGAPDVVSLPRWVAADFGYFIQRSSEVTHGQPAEFAEITSRLAFSRTPQTDRVRLPIPPNQMVYSSVAYLPQAVVFEVTQAAGGSLVVSVWAGRLAVLLASVAVTILALELMPFWARWTSVALSLLPMAVYLRGSLAPDAMVTAISLLGIAVFLAGARRREIGWPSIGIVFVACLYLAAVKPTYICILLLSPLWWLDGNGRKPRRRGNAAIIAALWLATLAVAAWHTNDVAAFTERIRTDVAPAEFAAADKLHLLVTSPLTVAAVFAKTVLAIPGMGYSMIARFGWGDINPHPLLHTLVIAWCVGVVFLDRYPIVNNASLSSAALMLATFIAQGLVIFVTLWLAWTLTASPMITGIQGRYFLPALPCGILSIAVFLMRPLLAGGKDEGQTNTALMMRFVAGGSAVLLTASIVFVILAEFYGVKTFHVICLHDFCKQN